MTFNAGMHRHVWLIKLHACNCMKRGQGGSEGLFTEGPKAADEVAGTEVDG